MGLKNLLVQTNSQVTVTLLGQELHFENSWSKVWERSLEVKMIMWKKSKEREIPDVGSKMCKNPVVREMKVEGEKSK